MRSIKLIVLFIAFVWISALCAQTATPDYPSMSTDELKVLADKNDAEACFQLGLNSYEAAEATYDDYYYDYEYEDYYDASEDSDYAEALKWFIKAGDLGHNVAQNYLGIMYKNGEGTAQNYSEAFKWYSKAAAKGNKYSQYNLGNCYAEGWTGPKDEVKASGWYLKAAENLHPWSQGIIAQRYADGTGVTKDNQKAYYWSYISANYGDSEVVDDAETLNATLIPLLTTAQKAKIEKDADAWIAAHPDTDE